LAELGEGAIEGALGKLDAKHNLLLTNELGLLRAATKKELDGRKVSLPKI